MRVEVSHPDKVLFPDDGLTKRDLVDHYLRVARFMVPHTRDRPLAMHRFPNGIGQQGFYHKSAPEHAPDWLPRVEVPRRKGGAIDQVVANNATTLAWLANYGTITPHVTLARAPRLGFPDRLVVDLDPSDDDFGLVRRTAHRLREVLRELGLEPWLMVTGSRGVHLVCPVDGRTPFDPARAFVTEVVDWLAALHPRELTREWSKDKRGGRLYLDVARNGYAQLTVAPYAVRALPGAPVAAPIEWDELDEVGPREWDLRTIAGRLEARGDPWQGIGRHARSLAQPMRRLADVLAHA